MPEGFCIARARVTLSLSLSLSFSGRFLKTRLKNILKSFPSQSSILKFSKNSQIFAHFYRKIHSKSVNLVNFLKFLPKNSRKRCVLFKFSPKNSQNFTQILTKISISFKKFKFSKISQLFKNQIQIRRKNEKANFGYLPIFRLLRGFCRGKWAFCGRRRGFS